MKGIWLQALASPIGSKTGELACSRAEGLRALQARARSGLSPSSLFFLPYESQKLLLLFLGNFQLPAALLQSLEHG